LLQSPSSQYPPPSTSFHLPPTTRQTYTCISPSSPFPLPPRPCQTYTCNPPSSTQLPPPPPGKIPFHHEEINPSNIIQGYRSEITFATPFIYTELMKSCWESDPKKRPSASFLVKTFDDWIHSKREQLVTIYNSFQDAEDERKNSMTDSIIYIPTIDQTSQLISIK
ncbi:4404_t:CDS:2, partial [Rhizophagus irregularis]